MTLKKLVEKTATAGLVALLAASTALMLNGLVKDILVYKEKESVEIARVPTTQPYTTTMHGSS